MNLEKRKLTIKKLLYQSCNRGCKETDLIIGEFAKQYLPSMNDQELDMFARILPVVDADLYDWYTKKTPLPEDQATPVMISLMSFKLPRS